jgi:O-methyltransferase involved in polyketide biosynthesis
VLGTRTCQGIRGVVLLGAGMDTRAWRLGLNGSTVVEVDVPDVLRAKRAALAMHGAQVCGGRPTASLCL